MYTTQILAILISLHCVISSVNGEYTKLENDFNSGTDGWILARNSWQRQPFGTIMQDFPALWNSLNITNKDDVENYALVPYLSEKGAEKNDLSTMSRDIILPEGGELEILFSIFLVGWDQNTTQEAKINNPKLQVFYDEDMVFDIAKAVIDHQDHYQFKSWNQFKMLSMYRDPINITITMVGSRGASSPATSLVILDNIVIETRKQADSVGNELDPKGRSEPEAEMNMNGDWTKIDTEAEQEAKSEEEEKGRPYFCSLNPESSPCDVFPRKRYFFNETSNSCEVFMYECKGNENRFDDLETCKVLCANRQHLEPDPASLKTYEFTSFEDGYQDWNVRNWVKMNYSSNEVLRMSVSPPPIVYPEYANNSIGISPDFHQFDYRKPEVTQVFIVKENMMLIIEFQLLLKTENNQGILAFLFEMDPGLQIYAGSTKVYDFDVHGVSDGRWHEYRVRINNSDVEEYKKESGEQNILITIRGWLGTGGKGILVLDNLNVTQVQAPYLPTVPPPSSVSTSTTTSSPIIPMHCSADKEKGSCKGEFSRYYYNHLVGSCIQFLWTGCGGNDNRYISKAECESYCLHNTTITPTRPSDDKDPQIVCALPAEVGHCEGKMSRFHFSVETGTCEELLYSGCGANSNNFLSRVSCLAFCQDVTPLEITADESDGVERTVQDCELNFDPGTCTNYNTMYYYSTTSKTCNKFSYGGCHGNNNRFSTQSECLQFCSAPEEIVQSTYPTHRPTEKPGFNESFCSLPSDIGHCKDNIVRYYYSPFFENCFSFHWTGCGGNLNNFESWSECWVTCQSQEEDGRRIPATKPSYSIEESTTQSMSIVRKQEDRSEEADDFSLLPFVRDPDNRPQHVCEMKYDVGPCVPMDPSQYKIRFFHNITSGKCEKFLYGGCGGNHNNFFNKTDCQAFCEPKENNDISSGSSETTSISKGIMVIVNHFNRSSCFVSPRHGYCNGELLRWYYSRWDNVCKPYNYTGCGGNQNNFISKDVCEEYCPQVQVNENAGRCQKLRNRGTSCASGESRFFYDKYSKRCIRFTACSDLPETENNFPNFIACKTVCIDEKEVPENSSYVTSLAVDSDNSGVTAETIVEAIIVMVILGLVCFGGVLGWRRYQSSRNPDTYRLFENDRAENPTVSEPAAPASNAGGGTRPEYFNNPVYMSEAYDRNRDPDSNVQIPPLTLGTLGVIHEQSENSSFA